MRLQKSSSITCLGLWHAVYVTDHLQAAKLCRCCWSQVNMAIFNQDTVHSLHNSGIASWEFGMGSMLETKKIT